MISTIFISICQLLITMLITKYYACDNISLQKNKIFISGFYQKFHNIHKQNFTSNKNYFDKIDNIETSNQNTDFLEEVVKWELEEWLEDHQNNDKNHDEINSQNHLLLNVADDLGDQELNINIKPIVVGTSSISHKEDNTNVLMGLEIDMTKIPQYYVYSHTPGDLGLPLNIVFTNKSSNIAQTSIIWPKTIQKKSGKKYFNIYNNKIIIPIIIKIIDDALPVHVDLMIDYTCCKEDICIPDIKDIVLDFDLNKLKKIDQNLLIIPENIQHIEKYVSTTINTNEKIFNKNHNKISKLDKENQTEHDQYIKKILKLFGNDTINTNNS